MRNIHPKKTILVNYKQNFNWNYIYNQAAQILEKS